MRRLALLALVLGAGSARAGDPVPAGGRAPMPRFALRTLTGARVTSAELRGKVTVINFWATWCVPCMQEMTALSNFARDQKRIQLIGIATDGPETRSDVRSVVRRRRFAHRILLDPDGAVMARVNPRGSIPFTLLVDAKGRVAYRHAGYLAGDEARLAAILKALVAE